MPTSNSIVLRLVALCIIVMLNLATVKADRIVFVHGYIGFGSKELLGVGYWGFPKIFGPAQDYINQMRARGHQVLYASVGPLSSNWDRACELYAQIKGTRVDYGQAHSIKHGHARFGKDYTGLGFFPKWEGNSRISLIGHSMGGNTIRMLEYLLQNGAPEEEAATGSSTSTLFKVSKPGGNTWIHSIHTISAPHDGTPSSLLGQNFISSTQTTLVSFAAIAGIASLDVDWLYDFDLGQFGLDRQYGESFRSYYDRVFSSSVFKNGFVDNAMYDLNPEACWDFNNKTQLTYPDTYYFSYTTSHTHVCTFSGNHCPDIDMEVFLAPTALIMGAIDSNTCITSKNYCFSKAEWAENDGVVPVRSSRGPQNGIRNFVAQTQRPTRCFGFKCRFDNTRLSRGVWYTSSYRRDHTQIIGLRLNLLEPIAAAGVYDDIADTLPGISSPLASNYEETFETDLPEAPQNPAIIAAPVTVGLLLVAALTTVAVRRRNQQKQLRASSAEEVAKRASIVNFSSHTSAANPSFGNVNDEDRDEAVSIKV